MFGYEPMSSLEVGIGEAERVEHYGGVEGMWVVNGKTFRWVTQNSVEDKERDQNWRTRAR